MARKKYEARRTRVKQSVAALEKERFKTAKNLCGMSKRGSPRILAIDPDLHATGLCVWRQPDIYVATVKVPKEVEGFYAALMMVDRIRHVLMRDVTTFIDIIVVEGQELYRGSDADTKNPKSIMHLASAAGAAASQCMALAPHAQVLMPVPQRWKGSVPKQIHQARIYEKLGWGHLIRSGYCIPSNPKCEVGNLFKFNPGDWKHVGDAVGLAQWAQMQFERA